ncbi:hypothetical protein ACLOJK_005839 [Asimina triloba]
MGNSCHRVEDWLPIPLKIRDTLPQTTNTNPLLNHPSHSRSTHFSKLLLFVFPLLQKNMKMKRMESVKKLAKKVKSFRSRSQQSQYESLSRSIAVDDLVSPPKTPTGLLAVYVGEEHERFVVPMGFLSHPLFKMLLEKAQKEYGFEQRHGLVVPCSVSTFQEVVNAVESCRGQFDLEALMDELAINWSFEGRIFERAVPERQLMLMLCRKDDMEAEC